MAIRYRYDLYPRTDPRDGTRLVRFSKMQQATYRDVVGVGSGAFTIRSTDAEADFLDPLGEQYVRVVRRDTGDASEEVVGGFWINKYSHKTADRNSTKRLVASGAGTMAYLYRARMAPHSYLNAVIPTFIPQDPYDDLWRLYAQGLAAGGDTLGAVLWRVLTEALNYRSGATYTHKHKDGLVYTDSHSDDRTAGSAIEYAVLDFDQHVDSNGNDWSVPSGEFTARVLEPVGAVVQRLMNAGLYVRMNPDTFEIQAYENAEHRRDRTGASWGTNVVRFQAPTDATIDTGNMLSESEREIDSSVRRSLVWAGGQDVYQKATQASDVRWEGGEPSDVADTSALSQIASQQITARNESSDKPKIRIKMGRSPTTGRYLPWEEVRIEDLVTVHTGTGEWDHDENTYPVAALRIELQRSGAWWGWAELGDSFGSAQSKVFSTATVGAHKHPPNPELCRPGIGSDFEIIGNIGSDEETTGANFASDYAPWAGDNEERVTVLLTQPVFAGDTLIVVTADDEDRTLTDTQVYDQAGNTYTRLHSNGVAGGADDRAQIWQCDVTNALDTGDYVRFACNLGASLNAGLEWGARVADVFLVRGASLTAGTPVDAEGFNAAPTVSAPAGDLTIVTCAVWDDGGPIPNDSDWEVVTAWHGASTGGGNMGTVADYLYPAPATTWSTSLDQNRDWAVIAMPFTVGGTAFDPRDGHPDLVGTSVRATRCDHRHDLHRTSEPTEDDDEDRGYHVGTIWAQLDDLETPTEIIGVWMLVDATAGAAVWAPWPGGGLAVEEEGSEEGTGITRLNFTGDATVTVTGSEAEINVTGSGGGGYAEGTSFPGSPSAGDKFFHNTYDELFYYDGTRWLGQQRESFLASIAAGGVSADTSVSYFPVHLTDGMWLDELVASMFVSGTNNGSNFWELELDWVNSANTATNLVVVGTSADSGSTWVRKVGSIAAVADANARVLLLRADENGAAGNLFYSAALRWRRIGT